MHHQLSNVNETPTESSASANNSNDKDCAPVQKTEEMTNIVEKDIDNFLSRKRKLADALEYRSKLPQALKDLFEPLNCKLCSCIMTSTLMSAQHYDGQKHTKAIKKWVDEHPCQAEGFVPPQKMKKEVDKDRSYCKYCDVTLSSEAVAQAHYIGKKHQDVLKKGIMKNAYYDEKSKQWIRNETAKEDKTGRFGIGVGFLSQKQNPVAEGQGHRFFCDLCQVACPCQTSFDSHLKGSKHSKKLVAVDKLSKMDPTTVPKDNILDTVMKSDKYKSAGTDLSVFRTPSGNYYCVTCNISVNSQQQFLQHTESKKHKYKLSVKK